MKKFFVVTLVVLSFFSSFGVWAEDMDPEGFVRIDLQGIYVDGGEVTDPHSPYFETIHMPYPWIYNGFEAKPGRIAILNFRRPNRSGEDDTASIFLDFDISGALKIYFNGGLFYYKTINVPVVDRVVFDSFVTRLVTYPDWYPEDILQEFYDQLVVWFNEVENPSK